jgi:hypothetical protein
MNKAIFQKKFFFNMKHRTPYQKEVTVGRRLSFEKTRGIRIREIQQASIKNNNNKNKTFWKYLNCPLSPIRHETHRKRSIQKSFSIACVFVTEPLPSNDRGICSEQLPTGYIYRHRLIFGREL